ncbi:MAG: hypothetical protein KF764_16920 [Labilithrix sp.]|nr:hypothetical protein [Labilithrix sp.]
MPDDETMLEMARVIVLREQDVAAREHDLARRKQELEDRQRELEQRKADLQQLRFAFAEVASGKAVPERPTEIVCQPRPPLARAMATIAQRVLVLLEMEPRAFSPAELFNALELPPPIETLRTTLWKMAQRGLIARPFPGVYCARQYEAAVSSAAERAG